VMPLVASVEHRAAASHFRSLMAKYQAMELLVQIGEYKHGSDALADEAIQARAAMQNFLAQPPEASQAYEQTVAALQGFSR